MDYASFLASKRIAATPAGFEPARPLAGMLKPFQAECVRRALVRGRSALFAGTGLGKTFIEIEWASHVVERSAKPVLLLTPLAVAKQFEREAVKFGIDGVKACRTPKDAGDSRIVVTNYERLHLFDPSAYGGLVIDESSILKSYEGSTRKQITEFASTIPYRLAATATPAPNDLIELINHAELLDVLTGKEIIALFFTQDGNTTQKWRLKGHARQAFWEWLATWVTALRSPSDLGYSDDGYDLPPLNIAEHIADAPLRPGYFLPVEAQSLHERRQARRASMPSRIDQAIRLVATKSDQQWLIWVDLNAEQDALEKAFAGQSVSIRGATHPDDREVFEEAWRVGQARIMITKSSAFGFGLNWQHCHNMIFVGVTDSFEMQFQAIRRCWRFGQENPVNVHLIASEAEGSVMANLKRKERQADEMFIELVKHMGLAVKGSTKRGVSAYDPKVKMIVPKWLNQEAMT